MPAHLQREIDILKKKIRSLGVAVEDSVSRAVEAFELRDVALAHSVIKDDERIDHSEVDVEEECLKIVALYQPVAMDLRLIIAILKINSDLERIGDIAVNIAERAAALATQPRLAISISFVEMAKTVQQMVKKSLESLVTMDAELARQVCKDDDQVDAINKEMFANVQAAIKRHPEDVESLIQLLSISRQLERMADHTTNIAEDIIYMMEGQIVRHRHEEYTEHTKPIERLKILFLCTGNSCRSQMAEGWAKHLKSNIVEVYSAGTEPKGIDPLAVKVMAEAGIDISAHHSKHIDVIKNINFDYVITLCDDAHEKCPYFPGGARIIHVGFDDPPRLAGDAKTQDEVLSHYRRVRDEIKLFISGLENKLQIYS